MYDMKSTHKTYVNNKALPSQIYHKLNVFDQIRFGQSSRIYILRCLEVEKEEIEKNIENNSENIQKPQQKKGWQFKEIYIKLRENDPYYKQEMKQSKQFKGKDNKQEEFSGVTWGIDDEQEVYQYQDESQIALIPELLKRLPDLNEKQIEKIEKYEEKLSKYRNVEQEMQELIKKEQREYGLDEKLRLKKENLQAKLIETQQNLDMAENNVRLSIFEENVEELEEQKKKKNLNKFENQEEFDEKDEYFDRTLDQKKE
ncbi:hypothetical protein IMG5_076020 [Ichthyophthirius multifiliis]|uniref:FHA domain-containing protein n=1 Tax=Ichthyophthirius multifiliis TaxID=5932 RepID=G0QQ81_ICHMU|nr:hypothetical protein IMG5_076020 [Ichthyophthirius multifiliis]EGR32582.1 hypothetical protein IMG5_076020 [Ichthyophthirius multifiliis]|eukprot:XP_004036568.1 hypothetical protein IMG5_076020 [Ichthyophthirius multifiliis]